MTFLYAHYNDLRFYLACLTFIGAAIFLATGIVRFVYGPRKFIKFMKKYQLTELSTEELNTELMMIANNKSLNKKDREFAKRIARTGIDNTKTLS